VNIFPNMDNENMTRIGRSWIHMTEVLVCDETNETEKSALHEQ